jgi:small-conductance mechanosensitive channel
MTTSQLIVVIIILIWNLAVSYLPFAKKVRARLSFISIAVLVVFCLLNMGTPQDSKQHIYRQIAWNQTHHPQTAKAMMAAFNVSEEELATKAEKPTPIEGMVFIFLALALLTPLWINVAIIDSDDDATIEKEHQLIFVLNAVAGGLFLSLYFGLELPLIPWFKKSQEGETLRDTQKETHIASC